MTPRKLPKVTGLVRRDDPAIPNTPAADDLSKPVAASYRLPSFAQEAIGLAAAAVESPANQMPGSGPLSDSVLIDIDVDLLDDSPYQNRIVYDEDQIAALGELLEVEQIEPVLVRAKPDGRFELISGHRRKRAAIWRGIKTLKAMCRLYGDADAAYTVLIANEARESLGDFERALGYQMQIERGDSQSDVARRLRIARSLVSQRMAFFKLPEGVLARLHHYPSAFSHHYVKPLLDILEASPSLEEDVAEGVTRIGAGEIRPDAFITELSEKSGKAQAKERARNKTPAVRLAPLTIVDRGNRPLLTIAVARPGSNKVELKLAKTIDARAFTEALSRLLRENVDELAPRESSAAAAEE